MAFLDETGLAELWSIIGATLGKFNLHWWRRRHTDAHWEIAYNAATSPAIYNNTTASVSFTTLVYSASVNIADDGTVSLASTTELKVDYTNYTNAVTLRGKYYKKTSGSDTSTIYYVAPDAEYSRKIESGDYYVYIESQKVFSAWVQDATDWEYLLADSADAYPNGEVDSAEYEYLGIPLENAVVAPKMERGSYVGSGASGEANARTLTFSFKPQILIIVSSDTPTSSASYYGGNFNGFAVFIRDLSATGKSVISWGDNSVTWYATGAYGGTAAEASQNRSGTTYYYIAFGQGG